MFNENSSQLPTLYVQSANGSRAETSKLHGNALTCNQTPRADTKRTKLYLKAADV